MDRRPVGQDARRGRPQLPHARPGAEYLHDGRERGDAAHRALRHRSARASASWASAPNRAPTTRPGAVIVKGMLDEGLQAARPPAREPLLRGAGVQARLPRRRLRAQERAALPRARDRGSLRDRRERRHRRVRARQLRRADAGGGRRRDAARAQPQDARRRSRAHRQRLGLPRRRFPQARAAQHHPRQAQLPFSGLARVQRQVLHDLLPRRDAARAQRHDAPHGPATRPSTTASSRPSSCTAPTTACRRPRSR